MKLNILSISENLPDSIVVNRLITYDPNRLLEFPSIITTGSNMIFEPGNLYIANSSDLPDNLSSAAGADLICIGNHPLYGCDRCNILVLTENSSLAEVFSHVSGIFWRYSLWEEKMFEMVSRHSTLNELVDEASPLFKGNVLGCFTENKMIAGKIYSHLLTSGNESKFYTENELPVSTLLINPPIRDPKAENKREVIQYSVTTPSRDFQIISRYLFIDDKQWGTLSVSDFDHPFSNTEKLILNRLADILEAAIAEGCCLATESVRAMRNLIQAMLDGIPQTHEYLQRQLSKLHIDENSKFLCLCLKLNSTSPQHMLVSTIRSKISSVLDNAFVNTRGNDIVIVSNVTGKQTVSIIIERVQWLIGAGSCRIGVSNTFNDIENVAQYYNQASEAINLGSLENGHGDIYKFSDYAADFILEQSVAKMPAQFIAHPGILALYRSDRDSDSEYINTLRTYFKNSQNAVRTAEELFIHRSTLIYRLEQIKKIMGCDWEEYKDKLYMMYSIELLKWLS